MTHQELGYLKMRFLKMRYLKTCYLKTRFAKIAACACLLLAGCEPTAVAPAVSETSSLESSSSESGLQESKLPESRLPEWHSSETTTEMVVANGASPSDSYTQAESAALTAFLPLFDRLSAKGFVPTLRSGSTGVGYTLETMLDIEENNSPGGDFLGMELKAFRDADIGLDDAEKMNLFLKEPKWIDGLRASGRVEKYGYVDDNGRTALYSTVTIEPNSHGFCFAVEPDRSRVWLDFRGKHVAYWTQSILQKRLKEKHAETVFVSARSRGKRKSEQFHYVGVTWCKDASADRLIELLLEGDVMLELRMHLKESGATRNHGSAFRIKQNRIRDLFEISKQVRP
jgi:hypothetical protein